MAEATLWERVDEPVLGWVASLPPSLEMQMHEFDTRDPEAVAFVSGLSARDVHESLMRLHAHGLIDGSETGFIGGRNVWSKLRVTAAGWIALGEWPDLDRVASAASLHRLLTALADDAPEEERGALRRAAGFASRTADEVVRGTAADIASTIGREVAD